MLNPKFVGILSGGEEEGEEAFTEKKTFIKLLVAKMTMIVFSPGDFAIEEGDFGNEVYFIATGTVAVLAGGKQVATLNDGACFGEIALLVPGALRTATIMAITFCEVFALMRVDFAKCLEGFPEMHSRIRVLAEQRVTELKEMASKSPSQRHRRANVAVAAKAFEEQALAPATEGEAPSSAPVEQPPTPRGLRRNEECAGGVRDALSSSRWRGAFEAIVHSTVAAQAPDNAVQPDASRVDSTVAVQARRQQMRANVAPHAHAAHAQRGTAKSSARSTPPFTPCGK